MPVQFLVFEFLSSNLIKGFSDCYGFYYCNQTLPINQSNKDPEKNDKKKKECPERKRPASAYALWCKDQWNEVQKLIIFLHF